MTGTRSGIRPSSLPLEDLVVRYRPEVLHTRRPEQIVEDGRCRSWYAGVKEGVEEADDVVVQTDADREGEDVPASCRPIQS